MALGNQLGAQDSGDWWSANLPQIDGGMSNLGAPQGGNVDGGMVYPGGTPNFNEASGGVKTDPSQPPMQAYGGQAQGGDPQAFIQQWQASHSPSEGIEGLAAALKANGFSGERFMYGNTPSNNELVIDGQKFKVLGGEGTPGAYWYKPGMNDSPGGGGAGSFGTGSLAQGYGSTFAGPSEAEFRNSPGYKFALEQGLQGVQRSAAAKGTLLTGGTLKDLAQYGTGLADQTYGDAFNRSGQTFDRNYNVWRNSGNDIFNRYFNLSQLGANSAQGAAS